MNLIFQMTISVPQTMIGNDIKKEWIYFPDILEIYGGDIMTEFERIDEIFAGKKWQGKNGHYVVKWCDLCDTATISCLEKNCHGSSCNVMGCSKCREDFDEFNKAKTCIWEYLTLEERDIYDKCRQLKKHIIETIKTGDKEIDWKKLDDEGHLSDYDRWMFLPEIYGKKPIENSREH